MAQIKKSKSPNYFISCICVLAVAILSAGCFLGWNIYQKNKVVVKQAMVYARFSNPQKTKVIAVEKGAEKHLSDAPPIDTRPRAAVADFTVDKSVKAELSGSAVAIKLEQAFGNKYRLVARRQLKKALRELRFQASDLVNRNNAKQFGKMIGAEYLISGSVIQLGSKITIACQIFNIETGEIRQSAEVSTSNIDDLNYIILREAADILVMSDAQKDKYIKAKINYPKNIRAGKKAFSARDYDKAVVYLKLALNAKRSNELENLLRLASEKAAVQQLYNERKAKYELSIKQGNKLLSDHKWDEAETVFKEARKIPGYEYDIKANTGIQSARGGADLVLKKQNAGKSLKLCLDSASLMLENAEKLSKNNITAYRKCSASIQLIVDFTYSGHYQYISKRAKDYLAEFIARAVEYQKQLNPPLPSDLIVERDIRHASLSGLAPGSLAAQTRQRNWAIKLGLPLEVKSKKVAIRLRLIPPGTFIMGSPVKEKKRNNDEKQHRVVLSQPFYCGKFEISQKQWKRVMGTNPSYFKDDNENFPVEQVSWNDCQAFLKKLCELEEVPQGTYRLPTEEQWEYACRAGTTTAFYYGNILNSSMAKFKDRNPVSTLPTGSFKANAWGLYDMHGNVWEWCMNCYNSSPDRVIRGGSWNTYAKDCRSAARVKYWSKFRFNILGFRIIRVIYQQREPIK
ncbi:MAG: SUMF1/EgtB/PvdO family nonheme iron enzyme [Victivallales bacterium]|nr:SUMF1/EgtB/PvdO family nonheme iron enzyme [Victivallales bacterium]